MKRFIEGVDRSQATLVPEYLEDSIEEENPVPADHLNPELAETVTTTNVFTHSVTRGLDRV